MDDEAIAGLIAPAFETTPAEPPAQPPPEPAADGPAPPAQASAAPPPPAPPEPGHIPISALLEEREKRQGLEKKLAEIEAAQREAQAQARDADLPPDQQLQGQLWAVRRDVSRELLAGKHGEAEAQALEAWGFERCERDPAFNAQVFASRNPYEFIRQARQREALLAEVSPDDLDDYRAWKASRASPLRSESSGGQAGAASPTSSAAHAAPPPPPRSLVTAPNAGGSGAQAEIPVGPGAAFAATIRR
jgi:hypothetical protein